MNYRAALGWRTLLALLAPFTVVSSGTCIAQDAPERCVSGPVRPLVAALPSGIAAAVRSGRNRQDLAPYLNRVLGKGGTFDAGGFTYRIAGRLTPAPGTRITGRGSFLADPAFDDAARRDGLQMMIQVTDCLRLDKGILFDGGSITRPGFWLTGARNTGPVRSVRLDAAFHNLSFDGIDITRNGGAWRNRDVVVGAEIANVGWIGANLEGVERLVHDRLTVSRTGFHGIFVGYGRDVRGAGFTVDKSAPPYRVYDGPGGFGGREKGFLFGHFGVQRARWTGFRLFDNRNAAYDGFGIGEDGPLGDAESSDIIAQGEIWYAGLFGFDVSSNMTADVTVHYPARQGIQFGLDLGGTLSNVRVTARVNGNRSAESARFSASGTAIREIATQAGSPLATIVGVPSAGGSSAVFDVVPGQHVAGDGLQPDTQVSAVHGNSVTLDRPARRTATAAAPIHARFRALVSFENCVLDIRADETRFGLGVESGRDGFTRYSNVRVTGDLSAASVASILPLNGLPPPGIDITARRRRSDRGAASTANAR